MRAQDEVQIADKTSFRGDNGDTVYMLKVQGFGFTRSVMTDDKEEFESWPGKGTRCTMTCDMIPNPKGLFQIAEPKFKVKAA